MRAEGPAVLPAQRQRPGEIRAIVSRVRSHGPIDPVAALRMAGAAGKISSVPTQSCDYIRDFFTKLPIEFSMRETPNDDDPVRPADDDTYESYVAEALWAWSVVPPEHSEAKESAKNRVASGIEGYYRGIFQMRKQRPESKWCTDGFYSCYLAQPAPTLFEVHGTIVLLDIEGPAVTYSQAPFAASFEFANPNDRECRRIVLRFGRRNADGTIRRIPYDSTAKDNIPESDEDWAFAVELS
jgi:hypothetical protein